MEGKIAIVTGASSGIGRAIAIALSQAGAKVALAARRMERLEEINKEIVEQEGICICVRTDVTKREEVFNSLYNKLQLSSNSRYEDYWGNMGTQCHLQQYFNYRVAIQFYRWRLPEYSEVTIDLLQIIDKLDKVASYIPRRG